MAALIGAVPAPALHVMTFNIRRRLPLAVRPADRWQNRRPRLAHLLAGERPTLLAVQEALPDQAAAVARALGGRYVRLGHGRAPGPRGEACPLFVDTERLEPLRWEQRALSERPGSPGSTGWGSPIPRVFVEAVLRDRVTGTDFLAVGTHLDVFSERARRRSADAIRDRVIAHALPAVVLGDMNASPSSVPLRRLRAEDLLVDAWSHAHRRLTPEWGTYARYRRPRIGAPRIDAVLVTADITVERIGIHGAPTAGGWPSDHLPVQAVLHLPKGAR